MGVITLDDGRSFKVDDSFGKLPAEQQQAIVGELKQQLTGGVAQEMSGTAPVKDSLKYRSNILPLGKTEEGKIVPAVPGLITGIADTIGGFMRAGEAGPPGSRDVTEAAIGPSLGVAATMGPAVPEAAASAAKQVFRGLTRKPEVPTTDELHDAGSALYKSVEQSGVAIKPDAFRGMVSDLVSQLKGEGFDKDLQPRSAAALRRLASEAQSRKPQQGAMQALTGVKTPEAAPVGISEFDNLRKVAQAAAKSNESDDRRIGGIIKSAMDDFLGSLDKKDVVGGDSERAASSLKQARELWQRYSKSSEIDRLFDNAALDAGNYNAAGYENAVRNQFKTLAKNQNRMRKFNADERSAIRAVAQGSKLQTAMTKLGKFSPTSGFFAGILTGEIALQAASNPALLLIPGVGAVAKYAATKMRASAAESARKVIAGGKTYQDVLKRRNARPGPVL